MRAHSNHTFKISSTRHIYINIIYLKNVNGMEAIGLKWLICLRFNIQNDINYITPLTCLIASNWLYTSHPAKQSSYLQGANGTVVISNATVVRIRLISYIKNRKIPQSLGRKGYAFANRILNTLICSVTEEANF